MLTSRVKIIDGWITVKGKEEGDKKTYRRILLDPNGKIEGGDVPKEQQGKKIGSEKRKEENATLNTNEEKALDRYIMESEDLNRNLRRTWGQIDKLNSDLQDYVKNLDAAISKKSLKENKTVYRGLELEDSSWFLLNMKKGNSYLLDGFTSVTSNRKIAEDFSIGGGMENNRVLLEIDLQEGVNYANVESGLDEMLLQRKMFLKFDSIKKRTNKGITQYTVQARGYKI